MSPRNLYLVRQPGRSLMVDTSFRFEQDQEIPCGMMEVLGVSYRDLDVFITHGHPDHMGPNVFSGQSKCLQAQPYDTIRYLTKPCFYVRLSRIWRQYHLCIDCHREFVITSPVTGGMISLSEVKDETFANEMLGQGIVIKPVVGKVVAPFECPGQCSVRSPQNV